MDLDKKLIITVHDSDPRNTTDTGSQEEILTQLVGTCESLGETKPELMTSDFQAKNSAVQITTEIISGLTIPVVATSAGLVIKHAAPLIAAYLENRPQKEIVVDYKGHRLTVKGGGNVLAELNRLKKEIDEEESKNS